jgi:tRNA threonylcarbamoyladenosine biosynthesis protein TsaB
MPTVAPTDKPCLLCLDTATETMALALCVGPRTWVRELPGGAAASATLLPALMALLAEAGLHQQQLDAIAFGQGPGAFTGLRTSAAVAQGLAFGLGCPVLPIDSLLLVAEAWRLALPEPAGFQGRVQVAMDARMGEIYSARYHRLGADWQLDDEPRLLSAAALAQRASGQTPRALVGSACTWPEAPFGLAPEHLAAQAGSRAAALASLARQQWHAGAALEASLALPVYLRDKVALTTAERAAAKQGQTTPMTPTAPTAPTTPSTAFTP